MLPTIAIPQVTNEKITLSVDSSKELELPERLRLYVCFHWMSAMDRLTQDFRLKLANSGTFDRQASSCGACNSRTDAGHLHTEWNQRFVMSPE
jgi:hypothetical protein